ncbi:MAG: DEAD/DEAH box helicase family protein [Bacteroidales bacterium]|jgi:superfamily II DNA or RNA helicase|nr:DEAD/DEAH box helicase family protein [Bacteroidales bacterium]
MSFNENIKFKYSWRKYQQRVLDDLQEHLEDSHLHVVAPPGSGKTVLGLEVALRLNKPTLILAPTLAIRNQWIQRFCELFLQTETTPNWISRDIRNPKFLTVSTYQGLHAACNNLKINEEDKEASEEESKTDKKSLNENLNEIARKLNEQKIKTLVLDEAHHLKNEWWQTLIKIKGKISPVVVGLTATPPYDVTPVEWQRYIEINGVVDAEISVPELVVEKDLCPHQDYMYFTFPTKEENQGIVNFRQNLEKVFSEIKNEKTLIEAVESHPIWQNPDENLDWIYNNLACYSACLIFLNHNCKEISEKHIEIIGNKKLTIPTFDYQWAETMLNFYLYKNDSHFKQFETHQAELENKLKRYGIIDKRQIFFTQSHKITGLLTQSISKLNGIKEIVDFEYNVLGNNLRMVILSDYIRKEFYVNDLENKLELNKMGIMPIFEKLRRENHNNKKIGVLTGSLVIIPKTARPAFEQAAKIQGIEKANISSVPFDTNFLLITQTEQLRHDIVNIITRIFEQGEIEILIGTKSLLGEGWDAPAINSLILASFVGSFVLSNQMRGRAIRTCKSDTEKTGNIWHIVCIDPTNPTNNGEDFDRMKRRFKGFVGISTDENPQIENGLNRLHLPEKMLEDEVATQNNKTFLLAENRENLQKNWQIALEKGVSLVEEIKIPFGGEKEYKAIKSMYLHKTIANLLATLSMAAVVYLESILQGIGRMAKSIKNIQDLYIFLLFIALGFIGFFGKQTLKTLKLYFKYRDIAKDIQNIGDALLNSLQKAGVIHSDIAKLSVIADKDEFGCVYCYLKGGTTFEKSVFIKNLHEIIGKVENPRYIIIRKNKFLKFLEQRDFHSVPELLGKNKTLAEYLANQWRRLVGNCELVFTRTVEGRKLILKSRMKSLASQFEEKTEQVNKWV